MKKSYITPTTEEITINVNTSLLTASFDAEGSTETISVADDDFDEGNMEALSRNNIWDAWD